MKDYPSKSSAESDAVARAVTVQSDARFPQGYPYREIGGGPEKDIFLDLRNVLRVLNKRKWLIATIAASFGALGLLRALLQEPLYASTVRLQISRSATSYFKSGELPLFDINDSWFNTEVELLNSGDLAERVASLAHFGRNQGPDANFTDVILGGRTIKAVKATHLVDITYTDRNPARAQRVARAYGEAYVALNQDKRLKFHADAKLLLEDQLNQLKQRLENADKAVLAFAEKERIIGTTDKASITESNLLAANGALSGLVTERVRNEELLRQVQDVSRDLPQILANKAIEDLRSQRRQLSAEYREKSESFGAAYPTMVQLRSKLKEIDHQLDSEVRTIKSSLKAAFEASQNQENEMKQRVEQLRGEMLELQRRSIQYNILKHDAEATRSLYDSLLGRYKEVDVSGDGMSSIFIVSQARLPRAPILPDRFKSFLSSLALGLGIGVAIAWVIERLDDRVYVPVDAEQASGLTLLGVIPKPKRKQTFAAANEDLASPVSDAFRSACLLLQFSTEYGVPKTLMITSANPAEGKSSTSLGIAREFAAMGLKVLVIDADLRNPSLHIKADLDNNVGLTTYLTRNCKMGDAIQSFKCGNHFIMTSGPTPPNPVELVSGPRFAFLLSESGKVFDLILIDSPPVMGVPETLLLSNAVTTTVLIIAAGETRISQVRTAVKLLRQARGIALGMILTKFDYESGHGYEYGYGYGYEYRNQEAYRYGDCADNVVGDRLEDLPGGSRNR
jgi:capsular exopolysaccharide synthesis family protein